MPANHYRIFTDSNRISNRVHEFFTAPRSRIGHDAMACGYKVGAAALVLAIYDIYNTRNVPYSFDDFSILLVGDVLSVVTFGALATVAGGVYSAVVYDSSDEENTPVANGATPR